LALPHALGIDGIVTFSAGVSTKVPGQGAVESRSLVMDADTALYAAKAGGRDMVKVQPSASTAT